MKGQKLRTWDQYLGDELWMSEGKKLVTKLKYYTWHQNTVSSDLTAKSCNNDLFTFVVCVGWKTDLQVWMLNPCDLSKWNTCYILMIQYVQYMNLRNSFLKYFEGVYLLGHVVQFPFSKFSRFSDTEFMECVSPVLKLHLCKLLLLVLFRCLIRSLWYSEYCTKKKTFQQL